MTLVTATTNTKVIQTGCFFEVYDYKNAIKIPQKILPAQKQQYPFSIANEENRKKHALTASKRAEAKLRRLITGNLYNHQEVPKFLTLTFDQKKHPEALDLGYANYQFHLFRKRLTNATDTHLDYVAVPEKQKNGFWHYHIVMLNMPFMPYQQFEREVWRNGATNMKRIYRSRGTCAYVSKYLRKSFSDTTIRYKKRYFQTVKHQPQTEYDPFRARHIITPLFDLVPKFEHIYNIKKQDGEVLNIIRKREYILAPV